VLEGKTYEEIFQEDPNEFSHDEDLDDTFNDEDLDDTFNKDKALAYALQLDEDVHPFTPLAHEDKEMVTRVDGLVREPLHMVDEYINTFIQTGRSRWNFGHLIFDRGYTYRKGVLFIIFRGLLFMGI
jgi:hypothetical protein